MSEELKQNANATGHTPTDEEVLNAIIYNTEQGQGIGALRHRIKATNPTWLLSKDRLRGIKARGLADGQLREPQWFPPPSKENVRASREGYAFDKSWREARQVSVGELQRTFKITSSELIWGNLRCIVAGMKAAQRDIIPQMVKESIGGGTVYQAKWNYRAAAKPGDWKIAKVQRPLNSTSVQTGWLMYHTSADPHELIALSKDVYFRSVHPRVAWVNRYDWGWHGIDTADANRTLADLDPEEWRDAWTRKRTMWIQGRYLSDRHPDWEKWNRLTKYNNCCAFFCDAERQRAPGLLKLLARPSDFEDRVDAGQSSSLHAHGQTLPFGIHLNLPSGREYEIARLIYGEQKSKKFPEDDELVAIWYDYMYYDDSPEATAVSF